MVKMEYKSYAGLDVSLKDDSFLIGGVLENFYHVAEVQRAHQDYIKKTASVKNKDDALTLFNQFIETCDRLEKTHKKRDYSSKDGRKMSRLRVKIEAAIKEYIEETKE